MKKSSRNNAAKPSRGRSGKPDFIRNYRPAENTILMSFLTETLKDKSRTTIKSLLAHRQVAINGRAITQFDTPVHPSDEISINFDRPFNFFRHPQLRIVFEDEYLIVVDKAAGLLSMGTDTQKEKTAYRILADYVKRNDLRNKIFILHRLDRETSGLMMFAKTIGVQTKLQGDWDNSVLERKYLAVVEGQPEKERGELSSYLAENSAMNVYSTSPENGKLAITRYQVMRTQGRYSLMELELLTGRKNQIRVHMTEFGTPVAGDKKYGAKTNPVGRLLLHANKLNFIHPITKQNMLFETGIPAKFKIVMGM
ncbi:MAG: RluA family pseudouridine synthase [Bacteroidales bacterium]